VKQRWCACTYVQRGRGLVAPVLALTMMSSAALADGQAAKSDENGDVFTLGRVEVVGTSESVKYPALEVVSGEDMLQFDTETVSEAANLVPGVTLSRKGGRNESTVHVRGFDLRRTPLYLDGIPIYFPYDGYPDLGRFFTYDLSELVISKGFASVLYGPNSMGGAINMVSRRPTREFEGNAGAGYSSVDQYHTFANFGTRQKNWYFQGGGSWFGSNGFEMSEHFHNTTYENGGKRNNASQEDWKVSGKLGLTPNSTDEYALSYIYQNGEKDQPLYTGDNPGEKIKFWRWPYWRKQSLYFTSNTAIGDKSYVKTRTYYDKFKNSLEYFTDSTYSALDKSMGYRSMYDDSTVGCSLEAGTSLIPNNELKMAFHFKDDVHREETLTTPRQRFEDRVYSFAFEDTIRLTGKLSAIIGISYDILDGVQAHKYDSKSTAYFDAPLANEDALNPQGTLMYSYSDTGKAHASVAMKTRFPSMKERTTMGLDGTTIPNPDLKPETTINYELGVQDVIAGLVKVKSSVFFNDIRDYIEGVVIGTVLVNGKPKDQKQIRNIGRVQRYGYELEAVAPLSDRIEAGFNYTFMYNKNRSGDEPVTDLPKHKFFVYGRYSPLKALSLLASLEYDTKRYGDAGYNAGQFVVINTKASYEPLKDVMVEVGVNNLLDRDYELAEGYPEPGRTFFVQARYKW
jgi:iron complex outermembrane recepter protein